MISILIAATAMGASVTLTPADSISGLTGSLGPGDVITFSAGTYELDSGLTWEGLGEEGNPIKFVAEGEVILQWSASGQLARLNNSTFVEIRGITFRGTQEHYDANNYGGLRIGDSSNVIVEDCTFDLIGGTGIFLAGNTSEITLRGNEIKNSRDDGIYAGCYDAACWTENTLIDGNLIHDIENGDGIEFGNGSKASSITNNVVYNIGDDGIQTRSTEYGDPNIIEGNVVWGATGGLVLTGSATVRNNIIHTIDGPAIYTENERDTLEKLVISFNTIYNTTSWGIDIRQWAGLDGMVFANNTITNSTGLSIRAVAGTVDEANYFAGNVVTGLVDSQYLDPLLGHYSAGAGHLDYTDVEFWNFYPSTESTLINKADLSAEARPPTLDFNGTARDATGLDVGAYEWSCFENPGWELREGFKSLDVESCHSEELSSGGCCGKSDDTEASDAAAAFMLPLVLLGWRRRRDS